MTGLVFAAFQNLKGIADIEYDIINSVDFVANAKKWNMFEMLFAVVNVIAVVPFIGDWWMAPPQLLFAGIVLFRNITGGNTYNDQKVFIKNEQQKHRKWHIAGLFFYLISWFIYFARAITAIMDIHIHGISPYD